MEISRWRQPPDHRGKRRPPRPGRWKHAARLVPSPLPGRILVREFLRWLTPPANFRCASGAFRKASVQPIHRIPQYLRANGFKTFIVSGGGIEFMRPWAEKTYGIPPEQVVGSSGGLKYEIRDGKPVLIKTPELVLNDDKEGKPVGIQRHIGRRSIAAFGNSDGDFQMLEWTTSGQGARFGLIVHHTDAAREFAYDRESHIGKLARGLDEAPKRGWTVVSMKDDWKTIFPPAK
jgi:hypothetical protein